MGSQILEWLRLGGPAMLVLLLMSVAGLTIVIVKLWEFWELRLNRREFVPRAIEAWHRGNAEHALVLLAAEPSPLAEVMAAAIAGRRNHELGDAEVREQIQALAASRLDQVRGLFRALEVIAHLGPLLGLLGTTLGMITAFRNLQAAGDRVNPAILSGGIWQALLCTAAGLVIAVIAIAALSWLERTVERLHIEMESALTAIFNRPLNTTGRAPSMATDVGNAY
ncbi:MAG TPA: MotA/TolQ/ExbB proton channel family protein [Solimonas sp.]|nr:MotA/TolQ/ExbB proton channel family protein [Solimonas sp.]